MPVYAIPAHQVTGPTAFVDIIVRVGELTIPACLVTVPGAHIVRTVSPGHVALAVAHTTEPSAVIGGSAAIIGILLVLFTSFDVLNADESIFLNCLCTLLLSEILGRACLVVQRLHLKMFCKPFEHLETSNTGLEFHQYLRVFFLELFIVDITKVLLEHRLAIQWTFEAVFSNLDRVTPKVFFTKLLG